MPLPSDKAQDGGSLLHRPRGRIITHHLHTLLQQSATDNEANFGAPHVPPSPLPPRQGATDNEARFGELHRSRDGFGTLAKFFGEGMIR